MKFAYIFLLVKTKAPSFQKEMQNIFQSQIFTDLKKVLKSSLPVPLDFPGPGIIHISKGTRWMGSANSALYID